MKIRNITRFVMATALMALAVPASADLMLVGEFASANGEAAEEALVSDAIDTTVMLDYKCESAGLDGCLEGVGTESGGFYKVFSFSGDPATSDVSWDLTGSTGYLLYAIIVKTANSVNLYEVTGDMQLVGMGTVTSPVGDSISHVSFFVGEGSITVPEPGTLALLGLGLIGMGAARRRKVA